MKESKIIFSILAAVIFLLGTPVQALVIGLIWALLLGNPMIELSRRWSSRLLAIAVVGLGAGMNLVVVARVGLQGLGYTAVGIIGTMLLGYLLTKILNTDPETSMLISVGTAICGGSAIAAVSSATHAKDESISISLATVFILNAIALVVFPGVGHELNLSQSQFGLWSALAIHDTSSVVGTSMVYGQEALKLATTVKLARALWIVPLTIVLGFVYRSFTSEAPVEKRKPRRPWFILGFVIMAALFTWIPQLAPLSKPITEVARKVLVLSLFCVGSGLSFETIKRVGLKPVILGVVLWVLVGGMTLIAIRHDLIVASL